MNRFIKILSISFSLLIATSAFAAEKQPVMVVLDGSNSMWGQVNGKNKIVIARESLATLLEGASNEHSFGLLTYGGSSNPNCNGVRLVGKPNQLKQTQLLAKAKRLNPKGRSPIAASLRSAARQLGNQGSILLVSDGTESCGGNPCAEAQRLKAQYPSLTIDVLGFSQGNEAQLLCIAENTGGRFVLAENTAAIGELFGQLKPLIAEKAAQEKRNTMHDNITIDDDSMLTLSNDKSDYGNASGTLQLSLGELGKSDSLVSNYFIYDTAGTLVANFTSQEKVTTQLPSGRYRVNALWREFKLSQSITITPNTVTAYRFSIADIGVLKLQAKKSDNSQLPVNFAIYDQNDNAIANYVLLSDVTEYLPSGQYRIKATSKQGDQEVLVTIRSGDDTTHIFEFADSKN